MGKGAHVTIQNRSRGPVTISYSDISCMHQDGEEGSDFRPVTGTISPGASIPASGWQYLEAKASGTCAFQTSGFTMKISGGFGAFQVKFEEKSNQWIGGTNVLTDDLRIVNSVVKDGDQYRISVVIESDLFWAPTWMTDLAGKLTDRRLMDVALPGTHDSGTFAVTALSTIAPDQDVTDWLNYLYAAGIAGAAVMKIIAGWSKTQGLNIAQQLKSGIRYFDLRVVFSDKEFYVCHSMYSIKVDELINDVNAFVTEHPREIVILDFNHLYQMSDQGAHELLVQKLEAKLGSKLAPSSLSPDSPIGEFQGKHSVIVLYDDSQTVAKHPQSLWPQSRISSPWPHTTDIQVLQKKLNESLSNRRAEKRDPAESQLFVLQGILTPDLEMIGKGLVPFTSDPGSNESLGRQVTPKVTDWIGGWAGKPVNIVIVDWFHLVPNYVDQVIRLNL